jgi:hypothetical protein
MPTAESIANFARLVTIESPDEPGGRVPFDPWPSQLDLWAAFLEECVVLDTGGVPRIIRAEKSRQEGVTWAGALLLEWCLFSWRYAWRALVMSYDERLVDDGGSEASTDSFFGKVKFIHEGLPEELWFPLSFTKGRIRRPGGGTIIGRTTKPSSKNTGGGGRGGSYRFGWWDEAAFGDHSEQVMAGFRIAARVKILASTANGKTGAWGFLKYKAKGGVRHLRFHWSQNPAKNEGLCLRNGKPWSPWYEQECLNMTDEDIARELDIDDAASVKGRALSEFNVDVHVKPGYRYEGGQLFSGWDFGIRATTFSINEKRPDAGGGFLVVTLAAVQLRDATADVLAEAFRGELKRVTWIDDPSQVRHFGDPAGHARTQIGAAGVSKTIIGELEREGIHLTAEQRFHDVRRRVRTTRLMLEGKGLPCGQRVRYVCSGDDDSGLKWFQECLEQCSWPVDREGEIRGEPGDLADNEYTHHADEFTTAIEGMFGGGGTALPAEPTRNEYYRPATAGLRDRVF